MSLGTAHKLPKNRNKTIRLYHNIEYLSANNRLPNTHTQSLSLSLTLTIATFNSKHSIYLTDLYGTFQGK